MSTGIDLITAERQRQINDEGWSEEYDDQHTGEELARAAACYAFPAWIREKIPGSLFVWPWDAKWWKPCSDDRIRELTKAGALIAAEIDRLLRKQELDRADMLFEIANGQRKEPVDLSDADRAELAILRGTLRAIDTAWTQESPCGPFEE